LTVVVLITSPAASDTVVSQDVGAEIASESCPADLEEQSPKTKRGAEAPRFPWL